MTDLVGKVLGGKYRLERLIGKGGMGSVYEAEHTVLRKRVAVKLLHPDFAGDAEITARFVREAQSASAVGHPNIIEIHDVGEDEGATFIVMELLAGQSLAALVRDRGRLTAEHAVAIARQVADGLEAAHAAGVVHRDLKADNVFLTRDRRLGEQVRILDFGISKVIEQDGTELTRTGAVIGTPHYMAPEQVRGERDVDARIDVWALGVMIYQMLTGRYPFPGTGTAEVLARILTEPMVPLESPDLPDDLVEIVERALEKDRRARYQTVAELKAALEPLEARSPSLPDDASELELAETMATPSGRQGPTTPGTASRRGETTRMPPAPLWKRILWYAITIPLCGVGLVRMLETGDLRENLALPPDVSVPFVVGIFLASVLGLMVSSFFIDRFWALGRWNRFLQGPWFILFPVAGLLFALYHFFTLSGQMESHLLSLRSYAEITPEHAARISELIGRSKAAFLSGASVDFAFVCQLAMLILLGYLFLRGRKGPARERLRWLVLPGGLLLIAVVEVAFADTLDMMGPGRFVVYASWLLTAVALIRSGRTRFRGVQPGWHILAGGVVTFVSFSGLHVVLGYVSASAAIESSSLEEMPPSTREWLFDVGVNPAIARGEAVLWSLMIALFVILAIVCRKSLPRAGFKRVAVTFGSAVVAALLIVIVMVAMQQAGQQWSAFKFARMQPVTTGDHSFYIDREPESLRHGADGLLEALTGVERTDYVEGQLIKQLAGSAECDDIVGADPARCVTAIEARLYCEANGKRLPTGAEWDLALGEVKAAEGGDLTRADLGEWTMRVVHGTAAFEIKGADSSAQIPKKLETTEFSKHVGFRCAFSFED